MDATEINREEGREGGRDIVRRRGCNLDSFVRIPIDTTIYLFFAYLTLVNKSSRILAEESCVCSSVGG